MDMIIKDLNAIPVVVPDEPNENPDATTVDSFEAADPNENGLAGGALTGKTIELYIFTLNQMLTFLGAKHIGSSCYWRFGFIGFRTKAKYRRICCPNILGTVAVGAAASAFAPKLMTAGVVTGAEPRKKALELRLSAPP